MASSRRNRAANRRCALAADADMIASGDKRLLGLSTFKGIIIITAVQSLERIAK
jgi:predicted nucleic acid-binding protein